MSSTKGITANGKKDRAISQLDYLGFAGDVIFLGTIMVPGTQREWGRTDPGLETAKSTILQWVEESWRGLFVAHGMILAFLLN